MDKFTGIAQTDSDGNFYIPNMEELTAYALKNKQKRFTITLVPCVSESRRGYLQMFYRTEVLPKCLEGFRDIGEILTPDGVEDSLCDVAPTMLNGRRISDNDFTDQDFTDFINDCIKFAAEYLNTVIDGFEE